MNELIQQALELCEKATSGPWKIGRESPSGAQNVGTLNGVLTAQTTNKDNAAFIAHARDDIPYLLSRLEKAEAALSAMRFAYVNKDPDTPHGFEVDAMNAAAGILGEWPPKGE